MLKIASIMAGVVLVSSAPAFADSGDWFTCACLFIVGIYFLFATHVR